MLPLPTLRGRSTPLLMLSTLPNETRLEDLERAFYEYRQKRFGFATTAGDRDWLREVAGDLEKVGHKLQVDTDPFTADLYERAGEIETERAEEEAPDDYPEDWRPSRREVDGVHQMFDDLRNHLMET